MSGGVDGRNAVIYGENGCHLQFRRDDVGEVSVRNTVNYGVTSVRGDAGRSTGCA